MKFTKVAVQNFGSYKELELDFSNRGLTLIQGATGSGKSTLCDIIPWALFGMTAKGGKADEVRTWKIKDTTLVSIQLEDGLSLTRSRNPNDCYYASNIRGKDLNDTQRLINQRLNINSDLYLAGAYFHEFSQAAQFFTMTAKSRRQLCEQIVDLKISKYLSDIIPIEIKEFSNRMALCTSEITRAESRIQTYRQVQEQERTKATRWKQEHQKQLLLAQQQYDKFEKDRKRIISKVCKSCGTQLIEPKEFLDASPNPHQARLDWLRQEENPYVDTISDYSRDIAKAQENANSMQNAKQEFQNKIQDLELLKYINSLFRSELINGAILFIKDNTNDLLIKHFDAEIQVDFQVDNDKVDILIFKDGNECSFTQLSKGQRQLLKLCFGISVMKAVQNYSGIKFEQLFFDESLDGLDETLKIKAYGLLDSLALEYDSIFVVEHSSALKALFPNVISVELINGVSSLKIS